MLRKDELVKIAEIKKLPIFNAERDYVLEVILFALYTNIKNELIFKGGTAMYKVYHLNRFSEDLDFTLTKHRQALPQILHKVIKQLSGIDLFIRIKETKEFRQQINVYLECKGPLYNGSKESLIFIPLNISLREKVQHFALEMLFSSYREIPSFEVYVMKEIEIAAEKVRAILSRDKAGDVYDLWFLLKKGVPLEEGLVAKKLKIVGKHFNQKEILAAIAAKEKMWEMDLQKLILGNLPAFPKVQQELTFLIKKSAGDD